MPACIEIEPTPTHALSPNLYMQFMEPLGATDGSVEAAWDHMKEDWRPDVVKATRELAPPLLRFGGCFSSYYRWREAVGPRNKRKIMHNLLWGGIESNQIGTHEFVDFCRRVKAEPFFCVNFESDGRQHWARPPVGGLRTAGPKEAAAWVDYCNHPKNKERIRNGAKQPFNLKLWQVGNETSYDKNGYDVETAAKRTIAFAKAMRKVDPELKLIGWGDSGWAGRMLEVAGEHLDYLAFHHMFTAGSWRKDSPLRHNDYRADPDATWEHLMEACVEHENRIRQMRTDIRGREIPLAITECHFNLPGRDRNDVLSTWAAGVANARILNVHQRHGDAVKIATLADFCGNRWQVNAVMIPTPGGKAYLMPVARVMELYRKHLGKRAVTVKKQPVGLDIVASRTGKRVFVHVVNTRRTRAVKTQITLPGLRAAAVKAWRIVAPPEEEIMEHNAATIAPQAVKVAKSLSHSFPAASVTALEIKLP